MEPSFKLVIKILENVISNVVFNFFREIIVITYLLDITPRFRMT